MLININTFIIVFDCICNTQTKSIPRGLTLKRIHATEANVIDLGVATLSRHQSMISAAKKCYLLKTTKISTLHLYEPKSPNKCYKQQYRLQRKILHTMLMEYAYLFYKKLGPAARTRSFLSWYGKFLNFSANVF